MEKKLHKTIIEVLNVKKILLKKFNSLLLFYTCSLKNKIIVISKQFHI